jgi:Holliday junction DNA helicase RuvB
MFIMQVPTQAQRALPGVELRPGLEVAEVHAFLAQGLQLRDSGNRILAFYLTEMDARRLHQASGHPSTVHFAEEVLGLDRRRTGEFLSVGRKLLTLPAIDDALLRGELCWTKVVLLMRVASPEHEAAWLERALGSSTRMLRLDVAQSKEGAAPRAAGDRRGLPEIRFRIDMQVSALTHSKFDLAKQKLAAERGAAVDDAECLDVLAGLFLDLEEDGSVKGRVRVRSSLYRIVLREEVREETSSPGELVVDTELGPVPVPDAEARRLRCDAEVVLARDEEGGDAETGEAPEGRDRPTPPALRARVLTRDGQQCRHCRGRGQLMVHHIRYRSQGGRTAMSNLISLCAPCHALVHADLLLLEGEDAERVTFRPADHAAAARRAQIMAAVRTAPLVPITRIEIATEVQTQTPNETESLEPPVPQPVERAFEGIVGQDRLLEQLEACARGRRARGEAFPHTIFLGPPGTGKTTLSRGVAALVGSPLHETCGPLLKDSEALAAALARLPQGGLLFIDEIHAVPRSVLELLYGEMDGGAPRGHAITVLAASTERGKLPDPLLSRFGLCESLDFYADEDLARIAAHVASQDGSALSRRAALALATASRGTPRELLRLLDRTLDEAALREASPIQSGLVRDVLDRLGFDREGLHALEQRYLQVLQASRDPVPLGRLARLLGQSRRTILRHVEPFLFHRGLVRTTDRGRVATRPPPAPEELRPSPLCVLR